MFLRATQHLPESMRKGMGYVSMTVVWKGLGQKLQADIVENWQTPTGQDFYLFVPLLTAEWREL